MKAWAIEPNAALDTFGGKFLRGLHDSGAVRYVTEASSLYKGRVLMMLTEQTVESSPSMMRMLNELVQRRDAVLYDPYSGKKP